MIVAILRIVGAIAAGIAVVRNLPGSGMRNLPGSGK